MKRFYRSLTFKIGSIIVLVEVIALTVAGAVYVNRFSAEVDQRIEEHALLPGTLINAGVLNFDSVANRTTMRQLVGEELITGMLVGVNGNIFYSLQSEYVGQAIDQVPGVDISLFDPHDPQETLVYLDNSLVAVSPIFGADGQTPRFFVYVALKTSEAQAAKAEIRYLFVLGSVTTVLLTSITLLLAFRWAIFVRIAALLQVLARAAVGDLAARVEGTISLDEIGALQHGANAMIAERQRAEERIVHLNRVLRAIRNVNQLIARERDRDRLLQAACECLIGTQGFEAAWIISQGEGDGVTSAAAGIDDDVFSAFVEWLGNGHQASCARELLDQPKVFAIQEPDDVCLGCPLADTYGDHKIIARLEHEETVYGLLTVSVLADPPDAFYPHSDAFYPHLDAFYPHSDAFYPHLPHVDEEELELLEEVADDIAFALHDIELEERHKWTEEALRESERLYRTLFENTPMGIGLFSADGRMLTCNEAMLHMMGYAEAEAREIDLAGIYRDSDQREAFLSLLRTDGLVQDYEVVLKRRQGAPFSASLTASNVTLEGQDALLMVAEDITIRKQAEETLQHSHDDLEHRIRERTAELRKLVNAMAGREVRMAELKQVIRKLRAQLEEAGLEPVADDPLLANSPQPGTTS